MALPKQSAPKYKCILPSDGKEVEYRPFLVKEQKILMLAQEQGDDGAMLQAVQDLVKSVTYDKVKPSELAVMDLEYLFLKIRSKSIGETASLSVTCNDPQCEGTGEVVVNLDDVEVVGDEPEHKIMISDEIGVELRYPRVKDVNDINNLEGPDQTIEMLKRCMVNVYDLEEVYPTSDSSTNELNDFVESLSMGQLERITEFFTDIPQMKKQVESECKECGKDIKTEIVGLNNFFS